MDVNEIPLDAIDVSDQDLFQADAYHPLFARLRREDPVHYFASDRFGPFWSVTRYADIVRVAKNHAVYSSAMARGGVTIKDGDLEDVLQRGASFITMDRPQHTAHRGAVAPAFSPSRLKELAADIRRLVREILDDLPTGRDFDWVDRVATRLPMRVLAILLGVPAEDCAQLLRWSNLIIGTDDRDVVDSRGQAREELLEFARYCDALWAERTAAAPAPDLVSLLAHAEVTRDMPRADVLDTMLLLLVGGNDTTRNSISGGFWALCQHPRQYELLRSDHSLIPTAVAEMIRWVTPIAHMRRTAVRDAVLGGKRIRAGDKVVLWYVSGNRDEAEFDEPYAFRVDRSGPRHLSFGAGIHFCIGSRVAEMQLQILWEELLKRYPVIEPRGEPQRLWSNFINGIKELPVRITAP